MEIKSLKDKTNLEVTEYLRIKILRERSKLELSQEDFAKLANIPLRTYKRFEKSCNGSLKNFINVLRVFDKLRIFEAIFLDEYKHRPNVVERMESIQKRSLSRD